MALIIMLFLRRTGQVGMIRFFDCNQEGITSKKGEETTPYLIEQVATLNEHTSKKSVNMYGSNVFAPQCTHPSGSYTLRGGETMNILQRVQL